MTTMESLGLTQFDVIDSAHSGGELLGYAAEGMLRTNAERVGEAVEEQHTMETAAAALGRRLALAELAEKSEGGIHTYIPPVYIYTRYIYTPAPDIQIYIYTAAPGFS